MGEGFNFSYNLHFSLPFLFSFSFSFFVIYVCSKTSALVLEKFTRTLSGRTFRLGSVGVAGGVGGLGGGPSVRLRHAQTDPLPPPDGKRFECKENNFNKIDI